MDDCDELIERLHSQARVQVHLALLAEVAPTGSKLRTLTVIDTSSRFSPAVVPRFSFRAPEVIDVLERVCREVGYPSSIRVDQGSEFVSRDLDLWAYTRGVILDFSQPCKPTDNAFIESFYGRFRAECLNQHWFMSLDDAVGRCEAWRRDYPHSRSGQSGFHWSGNTINAAIATQISSVTHNIAITNFAQRGGVFDDR